MKLNVVPPRTGVAWVRLGIRTFWRQPLALAGLFFMYSAALSVLFIIPVAGALLATLFAPAMSLGLMVAAAEVSEGRFPFPTVLVAAFRAGRQRARSMLMLGVYWTVAALAIAGLASLVPAEPIVQGPLPGGDPQAIVTVLDTRTLAAMVLNLPVLLLFWFAPPLVHWHDVSPAKSLFFSAVACWKNLGALLVFGLAWAGVFLAASLFLALVIGAIAGPKVVAAAIPGAALLLMAVLSTSLYFTFRDSFTADPPPGTSAPADEPAP